MALDLQTHNLARSLVNNQAVSLSLSLSPAELLLTLTAPRMARSNLEASLRIPTGLLNLLVELLVPRILMALLILSLLLPVELLEASLRTLTLSQ